MYYCYIIYSPTLRRFYTGSTSLLASERIERHLEKYYGNNKFTSKVNDWELFYTIPCETRSQALKIERYIKKMKSAKYIRNLVKYPDIAIKLKIRFAD